MIRSRLFAAALHYEPSLRLHTAASGAIDALAERYLVLDDGSGALGIGGMRINVAYLTGVPVTRADAHLRSAVSWLADQCNVQAALSNLGALDRLAAPVRSLVEQALLDLAARQVGDGLGPFLQKSRALSDLSPAPAEIRLQSNQTLFWAEQEAMLAQAERYVARGFRELKLRVGMTDFATDLARLAGLRERIGDTIDLAIDVNGHWPVAQAADYLARLSDLDLAYIEQPLPRAAWAELDALARTTDRILLLDESLSSSDDITRLARLPSNVGAHLKLAKLGGPGRLLEAALDPRLHGRRVMIGQMNEGGLATAAATHCAWALGHAGGELYGADGLVDDPFPLVRYDDGDIHTPAMPGIGLAAQDLERFIACPPSSVEEIRI